MVLLYIDYSVSLELYISRAVSHVQVRLCMWQSRIELKHYSVLYFEHITEFDTLLPLRAGLMHAM